MSYFAQMQIMWEMFKDFMKTTFGSGVYFPLCPEAQAGYVK